MLNGDDNENGFKTERSNQQKNKLHVQHTFSSNQQKTNLHVQHAFLSFPCHCFARLQRRFVQLKRQTSQLHRRNCRMCLPNILFPMFMFAFMFHCRSFSPCQPDGFLIYGAPPAWRRAWSSAINFFPHKSVAQYPKFY